MLSKRVSLFVKFEISNISNSQNLTVYSINISNKIDLKAIPAFCMVDKEDNIWLSTNGNGIFKIRIPGVKQFNDKNGLNNPFITVITQDKKGQIWVGTQAGLYYNEKESFFKLNKNPANEINDIFPFSDNKLFINDRYESYIYINPNNKKIKTRRSNFIYFYGNNKRWTTSFYKDSLLCKKET